MRPFPCCLALLLLICTAACIPNPPEPVSTPSLPPVRDLPPNCEERGEVHVACSSEAGFNYWLSLPTAETLSEAGIFTGQPLPLLVYLHGFSHSGEDLKQVLNGGVAAEIERGRELPLIAVSPQCPSGPTWAAPSSLERLSAFVAEMITTYNTDPNRVYLTGCSMGGDGAWALGIAHPEQFAAVVPLASWHLDPRGVCALRDVPVWIFQSERDEVVAPRFAERMTAALEACPGNVKTTWYENASHDATSGLAYHEDELYDWMLKQSR